MMNITQHAKIFGTLSAVFLGGAALAGYIGLPARVEALEAQVGSLELYVKQSACMNASLASGGEIDWRQCLTAPGIDNVLGGR